MSGSVSGLQVSPSVGVELRASGDPHRSEKPGRNAGDMWQWQKKICRHPGDWEAPGDLWRGIASRKLHSRKDPVRITFQGLNL